MSGSLKFVSYTDDRGGKWALNRDESNMESVIVDDGSFDITPDNVDEHTYITPRNLKPRFATYKSSTTVKVRKVTIPTVDIYNALFTGDDAVALRSFTAEGETWVLSGLSPERIRPIVVSIDTGLNEGDM